MRGTGYESDARTVYTGEWLPSPVETADVVVEASPEARYSMRESVTFAFLDALEALRPTPRAVLILRDVFDYSTADTAAALEMTESNVKVNLHRARKAMQTFDRQRPLVSEAHEPANREALEKFLMALLSADAATVEGLLADDVRATSDGGGVFVAALRPIFGRQKVARFYLGVGSHTSVVHAVEIRDINGLPTVVIHREPPRPREAAKLVMSARANADGLIDRLDTVLAPKKLTAMRF